MECSKISVQAALQPEPFLLGVGNSTLVMILMTGNYIHAVSFLQDNVISTPELKGTILPGITRKSIIELARSRGYEVSPLSFFVINLLHLLRVAQLGRTVVRADVMQGERSGESDNF